MRRSRWLVLGALCAVTFAAGARAKEEADPFRDALKAAEAALEGKRHDEARREVDRALERDANAPEAWALRARWAEAVGDVDEQALALHRRLSLLIAQGADAGEIRACRKRVEKIDPLSERFLSLKTEFVEDLTTLAEAYEKAKRPHSAIRVLSTVLALDPERRDVADAIARISSAPDPSLAETARQRDLLADVSESFIREHDAKHASWDTRAKLTRANYVTETDAGYGALVRAAEAMEQMNAFYRRFFQYGTAGDGKRVPRISVRLFDDRDDYLKHGSGPPKKWSGGQFTGGAVETYVGGRGFERTTRTLFHEAAHQFVSLSTNAVGWLNEGLASYFEGCRIQANGTVAFNEPADHRLFSLASRMSVGWMKDAADGIDEKEPSKSRPPKAPTFRIVIENEYEWGPAWYAPTWGVVYFLHNYQDPADGRFVYRAGLRELMHTSGGKMGKGAVRNFEDTVLATPRPPTRGVAGTNAVRLPRRVDEIDAVWKEWILSLRDERNGRRKAKRPWLAWARHAITRKEHEVAAEHFEQGLSQDPGDVALLTGFAAHLADRMRNKDRAVKLLHLALARLEAVEKPDEERIAAIGKRIIDLDKKHRTLESIHVRLRKAAGSISKKYLEADRPLMTMYVSRTLAGSLDMPELLDNFAEAVRRSGKSLSIWRLAYNERDLAGWSGAVKIFWPEGPEILAKHGAYRKGSFGYRFLTLDEVTSGDFSLEAEVLSKEGENAFAGLVFGRKSGAAFSSLIFFPRGGVDLVTFYSAGASRTWRNTPVKREEGDWVKLRVDVAGRMLDVWCDGELAVSQEFPSKDVLLGKFGLIVGPGQARFRRVRFLSRDAADPSARIERAVVMERLATSGRPPGGSYIGRVPPWPKVARWFSAPRESWAEKGPVPTLLVFFSMFQNDRIPLEGWLSHLVEKHAASGLEVVAVAEGDQEDRILGYLAQHPFPGTVGMDLWNEKRDEQGATFVDYFIGERFNLPRALLLDIDGKVVWEGNPGLPGKDGYKPGSETYLDKPLAELIARRRLPDLRRFLGKWSKGGEAAFAAGDLDAAGALLRGVPGLPEDACPEVARVARARRRLDEALADPAGTAKAISELDAAGAVAVLDAWAGILGVEIDAKTKRRLGRARDSKSGKAWRRVLRKAVAARKEIPDDDGAAEALLAVAERIEAERGPLPALVARRIRRAVDAGDIEGAKRVLLDVKRIPAEWLATEFFRF